MNKLLKLCIAALILASCNNLNDKGKFSLAGEIKNLPDQKIFLEEIFFSQKDPEVIDTADIKNGKFIVSATAAEQGLYLLRLEKTEAVFIFINDKSDLTLTADNNSLSMKTVNVNSPANVSLKNFIIATTDKSNNLQEKIKALKQYPKQDESDSGYLALVNEYNETTNSYKKYLLNYTDSSSNVIMALYVLGFARQLTEPALLEKTLAGIDKRFPNSNAVASVKAQLQQEAAQKAQQELAKQEAEKKLQPPPGVGDIAPEITMPDTEGKSFSLSSLKGKYVLVDFWASWCGPCRHENPNVVNAYNKYKNKNFTILGVSLDRSKTDWLDAIKKDNLIWTHISDLKEWGSPAVSQYGIEGIPYNALVDPQGKIIATSLRGADLDKKLAEVLK